MTLRAGSLRLTLVSARPIPAARGRDTALLPVILKELQRVATEDCPLLAENRAPQDGQVFRLSERQVSVRTWVWDGKRFASTEATESPCRLFTAGGLPMTLWRAELR